MAGLKPSEIDSIYTGHQNVAGRNVVLYGATPNGRHLVSTIDKKEVYIVNSTSELNGFISTENNSDKEKSVNINSIIIVACPGDDVSAARDIYIIATKLKVLITTIVIYNSCCMPINNFSSLPDLRASSDMLIMTSDKNYLEYFLDCLL